MPDAPRGNGSEPGAGFTNAQFARIFNEIAAMLELKGESPFKVRAYRLAAGTFAGLHENTVDVWREGRLDDLPGVGKAITDKVGELITTGHLRLHDRLSEEIPASLIAITDIPHVGPKTAMQLYKHLGIQGMADLEKAIQDGRLQTVPGLGQRTIEIIEEGLRTVQKRSAERRELLGTALPLVNRMIATLKRNCPELVDKIQVAGSARRWKSTVGDIDILATSPAPEQLVQCFVKLPMVDTVDSQGENKATVRLNSGLQVDFYVLDPRYYVSLLNHFTGSRNHNIRLRDRALHMGYRLNEYGLQTSAGEPVPINTEEDIYRTLGLKWMPPELREDRGEFEAAERDALPHLLEVSDIKGDLQTHSTWSDGSESILDMARAAKARGYQYLAVTDHSRSLTITNGLSIERLHEQRKEIEQAQRAIGGDFRILHGSEVEIKLDGSLDYPDDVLAWLDVVVASIHSGLRQPAEDVTRRCLAAVRNPNVDIIGHPTGRLINQREPSAIDVSAMIREAARTGVALEVDSAPDRLDLDDVYVQEAMQAGCVIAVDTDAHHHTNFDFIEYGVHIARRGWATPDRVITAWPLDRLQAWLKERK